MNLYVITLSTEMSLDEVSIVIETTVDKVDKTHMYYIEERGIFRYNIPDEFRMRFIIDMDFNYSKVNKSDSRDVYLYNKAKVAIRNWKLELLNV
jgi:hypothetical protein